VEGQALQQPNNQTDPIGASQLEIGRRREFRVYLDDLLQKDGYGANGVPQQYWEVRVGLTLSAEQIQSLNR